MRISSPDGNPTADGLVYDHSCFTAKRGATFSGSSGA